KGQFYGNFGDGIELQGNASGRVEGTEIFANTGNGILNTGSGAVDARGVWWGAVDGPSGDASGAGDQVLNTGSGSINSSEHLIDGTEYAYFDAGGTEHVAYGINLPVISGAASTEWGTASAYSNLHDFSKQLDIDFAGLSGSSNYKLLVTYFGKDVPTVSQSLKVRESGHLIHSALGVPSANPASSEFSVPPSQIDAGNLGLSLKAEQGPRALVSSVLILKQQSSDTEAPELTIVQPVMNQRVSSSQLMISGRASDNAGAVDRVEVGVSTDGENWTWSDVSSISSTGVWHLNKSVPDSGSLLITARAWDSSGNFNQLSAPVQVIADSSLPASVTGLVAASAEGQVKLRWNLSIDDGNGESDVSSYRVLRAVTDSSEFEEMTELASGSNQYIDTAVNENESFHYRIKTIDMTGNYSLSLPVGPVTVTAGSDNTAPEAVTNLTASVSFSGSGNAVIFYQWQHSADTAKDLAGYRVSLLRGSDEVASVNLSTTHNTYAYSEAVAGESYSVHVTAIDLVDNTSEPSTLITTINDQVQTISLAGNLSDELNLPAAVYRVSSLTIPAGRTLTLKPGTIIKFNANQKLNVYGELVSLGTKEEPVVFTAANDDVFGGDTNGDGESAGSRGYWDRIQLYPGAKARLQGSIVRFGDRSNVGQFYAERASQVEIDSSIFEESQYRGIYVFGSPLKLTNSTIRNNSQIGLYIYDRNNYSSSIQQVIGNTFDNNQYGIYVDYDPVNIENNQIINNTIQAIHFTGNYQANPVLKGNTITGNASLMVLPATAVPDSSNTIEATGPDQVIDLRGQDLSQDTTLYTFGTDTIPVDTYVLHNNNLKVPNHTVLEVKPGVNVKFNGNYGLYSYGALVANGEADKKITFTSVHDDLVGGDTNKNSGSTSPGNGNWQGVKQYGSTLARFTRLNNVIIRYAGNGDAALYMQNVSPSIDNLEVSNSLGHGIRIYEASPEITGSFIWGNDGSGVYIDRNSSNTSISFSRIASNGGHGVAVANGARASVTNSDIFGNRAQGIYNSSGNELTATQNWWGEADGSGPLHEASNPEGTGQTVSDKVVYTPFKENPSIDYVYANFQSPEVLTRGNVTAPEIVQGTLSNEWDSAGLSPGKTMLYDKNKVVLRFPSLNPEKRYKIRATYFNGDPSLSVQSLTDGEDNSVHSGMAMPTKPTSYQFAIPQPYYSSGQLTLNFVHDNADTSIRGALSELWLLEDSLELSPPKFSEIKFNDKDGNGVTSQGDEYWFVFSEALDTQQLEDGTTDANLKLKTDTASIWGNENSIRWSADETTVIVTLTEGFTINGSEQISLTGLSDKYGNAAIGVQSLTRVDSVSPELMDLRWSDSDSSGYLSVGDIYTFVFNEAMEQSVLSSDDAQSANAHLRPEGGLKYGAEAAPFWSENRREVKVQVTSGFSILGDELVQPSRFIRDVAGNSVTGTVRLVGRDLTAPSFTGVLFDDLDGNGLTSLGDSYTFLFSEPMRTASVSNDTDEANRNLAPGSAVYGTSNRVVWSRDFTRVTVFLIDGFTVVGSETVTPGQDLVDSSGNTLEGSVGLNTTDTVKPELKAVVASHNSPVPQEAAFTLSVQFNGSMKTVSNPQLLLQAESGAQITVPTGSWSQTKFAADTYVSGVISLPNNNREEWLLSVSGAQDVADNQMEATSNIYRFRIQETAPAIANYELSPVVHSLTNNLITLRGSRPDNSSIWVNGTLRLSAGSGDWQFNQSLSQGLNTLNIVSRDQWNEDSAVAVLKFNVDSIAPVIETVYPANSARLKSAPEYVRINVREEGSGIDWEATTYSLRRADELVAGNWETGANAIEFRPSTVLGEGTYQVAVLLQDKMGLSSNEQTYQFNVDTTAPEAPALDAYPSTITVNFYDFAGTKEVGSRLYVNGGEVSTDINATRWSHRVNLMSGNNAVQFVVVDAAGNASGATIASIILDDIAPGAVSLNVDGRKDGQSVALDWSSYDEVVNGNDIKHYRVYLSGSAYSDVNQATLLKKVVGRKTTLVEGLTSGQTYHFAVVAEDAAGNYLTEVVSQAVTVEDATPPSEVTRLQAGSHADRISLTWQAPSESDLSGFKVYQNGNFLAELDKSKISYEVNNLERAAVHSFKISTLDSSSNESDGTLIEAVTWLLNPEGLTYTELDSRVDLSWNPSQPQEQVNRYFVFVETQSFTSVEGLTAHSILQSGKTSLSIAGLENGQDYYLAVVTENKTGGADPAVQVIKVAPQTDNIGPEISNIQFVAAGQTVAVENGLVLSRPGQVVVQASDLSGISRLELLLDDQPLLEDSFISDGLQGTIDLQSIADGQHTLAVRVTDTLENVTTQTFTLNVDLDAPGAPILSAPADGGLTNQTSVVLIGTSAPGAEVQARVNGSAVGNWQAVDGQGRYTFAVDLVEGSNALSVVSRYQGRSKVSGVSAISNLTLDQSLPDSPAALTAVSRAQGEVRLSWQAVDGDLSGYHVYRSPSSFSGVSEAGVERLTSAPISGLGYNDVPVTDGTYFYTVTALTRAGNESRVPAPVSAEADSQGPRAESVTLDSNGPKADDGRLGQGTVSVAVRFDEPLRNPPFFAFSFGQTSIPVTLSKDYNDDQRYTGQFSLTGSTPSGIGFLVFQAFDALGNQGSELVSGELYELKVDTQGPEVTALTLNPGHPLANTGSTEVEVQLRLNDDVSASEVPQLVPTLDGVAIPALASGIALSKDGQSQPGAPLWVGRFTLPADAGQEKLQQLAFTWQAEDDLGNGSTRIHGQPRFDVYQGDLPALNAPLGL
ncbi:MAG: right-handed parallel beta-helix repeat-containing protein, partial [Endozoicomonas sp.]|uniref:right-handed parallel beta-helix repeat-containing protein n=1 Tax=Endozoicomonas sp. TaxID=1892382 RepID=UPI003D9BFCC8